MLLQYNDELPASLFPDLTGEQSPTPARTINSRRREVAWRADLTRAWGYWRGKARNEADAAHIDSAFEEQLAEGPDFTRYHQGSEFRDAPRITLDGNARARLMAVYRQIERGTWKTKEAGKHGGVIGKSALRVLEAFLFVLYRPGKAICVPYEAIAAAAMISRRTVATVLPRLERMGLLTVYRRIKRVRTPLGLKVVQDINAYELHPPQGLGAIAAKLFGGIGGLFGLPSSECNNRTAKEASTYSLRQGAEKPPLPGPRTDRRRDCIKAG
jgi:hypothetical protein